MLTRDVVFVPFVQANFAIQILFGQTQFALSAIKPKRLKFDLKFKTPF